MHQKATSAISPPLLFSLRGSSRGRLDKRKQTKTWRIERVISLERSQVVKSRNFRTVAAMAKAARKRLLVCGRRRLQVILDRFDDVILIVPDDGADD